MQIDVRIAFMIGSLLFPLVATSAEPDAAVRVEGYLGYSELDLDFVDFDGFQGGGVGSASVVLDQLHLQADVFGDVTDYDPSTETIGGSGHVGWRDAERGGLGVVGAYNRWGADAIDDGLDVWRTGLEGEVFFDRVTALLNAGYMQFDDDSTGYVDAGIAFYPVDRARVDFGGGLVDIDSDDPIGIVAAGGEFMFVDVLAAFARWEGQFIDGDGADYESHSIVFGMRLYWGAEHPTLVAYDRTHFKRSCTGYRLIGSRLC